MTNSQSLPDGAPYLVHPVDGKDTPRRQAYSIKEFCAAYGLSKVFLHSLWNRGEGPRRLKIGRKVLITREAAEAWVKAHEQDAA